MKYQQTRVLWTPASSVGFYIVLRLLQCESLRYPCSLQHLSPIPKLTSGRHHFATWVEKKHKLQAERLLLLTTMKKPLSVSLCSIFKQNIWTVMWSYCFLGFNIWINLQVDIWKSYSKCYLLFLLYIDYFYNYIQVAALVRALWERKYIFLNGLTRYLSLFN